MGPARERRPRGRTELGESAAGGTLGAPTDPLKPAPGRRARPLRCQAGGVPCPASSCRPRLARAPLSAHTCP